MGDSRYTDGERWLPDDQKDLPRPTVAIMADGSGSVVVDMLGGGKKVKLNLRADTPLRIAATRIYQAGTEAKNIAVFYSEDSVDSNLAYRHIQFDATDRWLITHNLGRNPVISLSNTAGVEIIGQVNHLTINTSEVLFNSPIAGTAELR